MFHPLLSKKYVRFFFKHICFKSVITKYMFQKKQIYIFLNLKSRTRQNWRHNVLFFLLPLYEKRGRYVFTNLFKVKVGRENKNLTKMVKCRPVCRIPRMNRQRLGSNMSFCRSNHITTSDIVLKTRLTTSYL